jgi:glutamate 5-kinase
MPQTASLVLRDARRIVVKVGSSLVTDEGRGLDEIAIGEWCRQLSLLVRDGREVIMVSSGAIAEGMKRLGWTSRPHEIHELQAAAAVGQMGLAQMYETKLRENGLGSAQVLLTHADLADRERYLNARSTLLTLLKLGVIPVINENDTVVNDEIKFGDNDTLGALVANLVEADALVILTDQKGLYSADPRKHPAAQFVHQAKAGDPALEAMAGGAGSSLGRLHRDRLGARAQCFGTVNPGRIDWHAVGCTNAQNSGAQTVDCRPPSTAWLRHGGCRRRSEVAC